MLVALALAALAQASPSESRLLPIAVTDRKGEPITGLTAAETVVLENGAARVVTRLVPDERPLTVALVVDNSEPMAALFRLYLVEAVTQFVTRLPPGTRYSLWVTGDRPRKLRDDTDDRAGVAGALRGAVGTGGNTMLDALIEAGDDLRKKEGARVLVLAVSGSGVGFANWDRHVTFEKALATGAAFGGVLFDEAGDAGIQGAGPGQVGRLDYDYVLAGLARESGGRFERTLSASGVASALARLAADLRGHYLLEYETDAGTRKRKVEVQVARPEARVRVGRLRP
jgi:VWFA-related protein